MMSVTMPREARAIVATAMIIVVALVGCDDSGSSVEKPEDTAKLDCRDAVLSATKYPSEADFPWSLGRITPADDGGYLVVGDVKLMNTFGAMIPHKYVCKHKDGRALLLSLGPG